MADFEKLNIPDFELEVPGANNNNPSSAPTRSFSNGDGQTDSQTDRRTGDPSVMNDEKEKALGVIASTNKARYID